MKGILEFDLPAESEEFLNAQRGTRWKLLVDDIQTYLRQLEKHGNQDVVNISELREFITGLVRFEFDLV